MSCILNVESSKWSYTKIASLMFFLVQASKGGVKEKSLVNVSTFFFFIHKVMFIVHRHGVGSIFIPLTNYKVQWNFAGFLFFNIPIDCFVAFDWIGLCHLHMS